jgi:hypothetical protein
LTTIPLTNLEERIFDCLDISENPFGIHGSPLPSHVDRISSCLEADPIDVYSALKRLRLFKRIPKPNPEAYDPLAWQIQQTLTRWPEMLFVEDGRAVLGSVLNVARHCAFSDVEVEAKLNELIVGWNATLPAEARPALTDLQRELATAQ